MVANKQKSALITGITGQDGSYLAEYLLDLGYEVHGIKRRSSTRNTSRIQHLIDHSEGMETNGRIKLYHADMTDTSSLNRVIEIVNPNEIYNLAAQSHVGVSFEEPEFTANSDALGVLRLLEIVRNKKREIRVYQASTSELFGGQGTNFLNENSTLNPRSPYASAKAYAYYLIRQYREAYGLFAVNGILFNHESPRRGEQFLTRKVTQGIAGILAGKQDILALGNLNAYRDWGHAKDYVVAMHAMLNHHVAKDYVIATGNNMSVRQFVVLAWANVGVSIEFTGQGLEEKGVVLDVKFPDWLAKLGVNNSAVKVGDTVVEINGKLFRPLEVDYLRGDAAKAREELGWSPQISTAALISEMVRSDCHSILNDERN